MKPYFEKMKEFGQELKPGQIKSTEASLKQIQEVEAQLTEAIELSNPLDASQRLRVDEVTESNQRDKFQQIAPDVADGLYRVPRVIE